MPSCSAHAVDLAAAAAVMTASQFRGHLRALVRRLQADDGMGRFERQRRATRLRMWTDPATGMGRLSGEFDPLTFATIERRVNDTMATLFAEAVPDVVSVGSVRQTGSSARVGVGGAGQR